MKKNIIKRVDPSKQVAKNFLFQVTQGGWGGKMGDKSEKKKFLFTKSSNKRYISNTQNLITCQLQVLPSQSH